MIGVGLGITQAKLTPSLAVLLRDSFDRANANAIGTADTGQTWQTQVRTLGINTNQAAERVSSGADGHAVVNVSATDVRVSATVTLLTKVGLVVRHNGTANAAGDDGYFCSIGNGTYAVERWTNGAIAATIDSGVASVSSGNSYPMVVTTKGTTLTFAVNGVTLYSGTPAGGLAGTYVGLVASTTTERLDNYLVTVAP